MLNIKTISAAVIGAAAIGLSVGIEQAEAATITTFTNNADWTSALGGQSIQVENFKDSTLNSGLSVSSTTGAIASGFWTDRLTQSEGETTTWFFNSPINAFGGDWNLAGPGGQGQGLALTISLLAGGTQLVGEIPRSLAGSFFGFTSDVAFDQVIVRAGTQPGGAETYNLDNLVYSSSTPIPTPALLPGLIGMGVAALRKRKNDRSEAAEV